MVFTHDKIFLSHNQGLSLYGSTLVVLSVQHQTLHVYHVDDGRFLPIQTIGRMCYVDDEVYLSSCVYHDCPKLRQQTRGLKRQREDEQDEDDGHSSTEDEGDDHYPHGFGSGSQASSSRPTAFSTLSSSSRTLEPSASLSSPRSVLSQPSGSSGLISDEAASPFSSSLFGQSSRSLGGGDSFFSASSSSRLDRAPPETMFVRPLPSRTRRQRHRLPRQPANSRTQGCNEHTEGANIIYSLKHRLLVFLYRLSVQQSTDAGTQEPLRQFYASFDTFLQLRMLKMQLLDEHHLLIKVSGEIPPLSMFLTFLRS